MACTRYQRLLLLAAGLALPLTGVCQQRAANTKPGVSSSAHPPRLRHRNAAPKTDADDESTIEPAAETMPESSSADPQDKAETITVTDADLAASAKISDAARRAVRITARDLDLHLDDATGEAEMRAQITVTNAGKDALTVLPVRVSGALHWESARLVGSGPTLTLKQHHLRDDLDHTGIATELVLPVSLAPGATVHLDLFYGGAFTANQSRLLALHAPNAVAVRTDWDTVTPTFTGLRGLGNVEWYPVTGPVATLTDGDAVPLAVEQARSQEANSSMHLRLMVQHDGPAPDAAFLLGLRQTFAPAAEGFSTAEWTVPHLGPHTPSLFLTSAAPQAVAGGLLRVVTEQADRAASMGEAAGRLQPLFEQWLGPRPARSLDVIDLPIPDAAGFSDGALLVAPLRSAEPAALAPSLVIPLANAWLPADISAVWLRDGIPAFLQALWAERSIGRVAALDGLAAQANTSPPPSTSSSSSDVPAVQAPLTPLVECKDAACARVRSAYVLEMLRTALDDAGLQAVLSGWVAAQTNSAADATTETAAFERLAQQVAGTKKLDWFFASWVHGSGSLPQLAIAAIAPRKIERMQAPADLLPKKPSPVAGPIGAEPVAPPDDPRATWGGGKELPPEGSWLVAVEVQNSGGTDAEVPVTVRNGSLSNTLPLRVPAHGKATIRIPFEAEPDEVDVNDGTVPEAGPTQHRRRIR